MDTTTHLWSAFSWIGDPNILLFMAWGKWRYLICILLLDLALLVSKNETCITLIHLLAAWIP